ncbi:lectin-like domain-containing protein [Enterococcus thailandicus]|uniref:lectin-like domain-containing protein n=1 Tax=Enterococcus thailandicus TaxID=417368 RepID=UPI0035DC4F91
MKKFTKMLVLQATVSLFIAPTMLASPEIVQAVATESAQENQNQVGNVSLQKVEQVESGNLVWTVLIEKSSSEMNRQMTFTVTEPTDVLSVYQPDKEQQVQPDKNGIYQIGENNQQAQTMKLEIQTKKIPQQFDYTLKISPVINEGEQQLLLNQKETYDFSFTATEETSSEETNTTEEETTATESSSSEAEETASETTETTSSAESATSSSTTKTSESTKNTSGSTTQRAVAPAVAARSSLARAGLGTGNPVVPKGAIQLDGIFSTVGKSRPDKDGHYDPNFSVGDIVKPGPSDQNNGMPYDEISLSGSNRAVGVWSNDKYRLDFNQDFHGRTYVNFGTEQADGFAFVMHNDAAKDQALTTANAYSDGQNLGVYGGTNAYKPSLFGALRYPDYHAIKNSVAIEFDLYANTGGDGIFDKQSNAQKVPHMAWNLPGDYKFTYRSEGNFFGDESWSDGNKAKVYHKDIQYMNDYVADNVKDGTWYEFRYNFVKSSNQFSYYLENPITGAKTPTVNIPWDTLNSDKGLNLSANEGKAYWGFTAANGESSGQTKFVFTQVPVDLGATVTNDVVANGTSIVDSKDTPEDQYSESLPSAQYGDDVTLKSTFAIDSAAEDVYDITTWHATLDTAIYDISKGIKAIKVDGKEVVGASGTVDANGNVTVTFSPSIAVGIGKKVTLEFTASLKAKGDRKKTYFESQITARENNVGGLLNFHGDEVAYWVVPQPEHPTVLSWETPNVVTEKTETKDRSEVADGYDLTFYWKDEDDGDILNFTINRNDPDATNEFAQIVTTGSTEFNSHSWHIPADKIVPGVNDYTITMKRGDEVQTLKLKLDVTGKLSFETAPDMLSWTGRKASESKGTLARDSGNPMTLSVFDSREDTSTWSLYVQAELTDATAPFDFVFKKDASSAEQTIMSDPVLVMRKGDVTPTDFMTTKTWNESEGVLLQSGNYMRVGDYSGKAVVKWNLYDTEVPE